MKTLIVFFSPHKGNTKKIAKVIGKVLKAKLIEPDKIEKEKLSDYDLIGFGSGIYIGKHHRKIFNLIKNMPLMMDKKSFIFSTSGQGLNSIERNHRKLRKKLKENGFKVIGEFSCKGFDTFGPLKLIGGINKDRPNKKDFERAEEFARGLKK